jgi:hypothetical protein
VFLFDIAINKNRIFPLQKSKMGLLKRFLTIVSPNHVEVEHHNHFGRYSDAYKSAEQYLAWDKSVEAFERGAILESIAYLMLYMQDEQQKNVHWEQREDQLTFEIFQGSRRISGLANTMHIRAESTMAYSREWNVMLLRRLTEENCGLKYTRYALDPRGNILAVFDSFALDASPYKLYYALKELATQSDKLDDLLLDEFSALQPRDQAPIHCISAEEMQLKYKFIQKEIDKVLVFIQSERLDRYQFPGAIGYLWLQLLYKLDYLIQPQGYMMELLERMHRLYFSNEESSTAKKNQRLQDAFVSLSARSEYDFQKEMYRVSSTFGITNPVNQSHLAGFIASELPNMDWYYQQGYQEVALAVPSFIIGYCLFNYAPPKPVRDLLHLFFVITEAEFFGQLHKKPVAMVDVGGKLNKREILSSIKKCLDAYQTTYPQLSTDVSQLDFSDLPSFAKSYTAMIARIRI